MSNKSLLRINNLQAGVEGRTILKGINLEINAGEVHAIMGPNGSGKSTLASVIAGREGYEILGGEIEFRGEDLMDMEADERAHLGLFLAFQYPVEIPGVNTTYFLKSAINETRKARGEKELDAVEFLKFIKSKAKLLDLPEDFLKRSLNVGFSGGEKKRNEIFQMAALEPVMAVLDETDSGLDIDALKVVANGVNQLRGPESAQLVITHYQRLLDYIVPDVVHVLHDGRIIKTGPKELAHELEDKGYDWVIKEAEQPA
ncbi:MAG: Fe-S cluster assembly ATPase SufC [Verrucomicrobia bacterium]|jgi:Fe-S cluster assembly ATP-binding protein|nr:Fe-S cluster assembly ATPase SufC [Verrucomicrobiota bacterium]MBT4276956.1 Fe-S cluster assembly ATPase SufC [Verrucomicrobiota bacterium]MBT5061830.1 Fe-S cluster assembly ATPase SufC [Verrucomicrobiota bacterium]MBT5478517.1 Fe-S cluster assembly ATPase SufC [Verrucomicrobiota bacterium]MBT6237105.1 Fe-S cluster assembly ATPase SufC [Verrucomicrobiota bacterium]